ncbi:MAG: acyl carrier protein [Vallitalea sp.]|jgi:acyl carrier protein|nr:acyl carrier protein [Vallitalea sp.]
MDNIIKIINEINPYVDIDYTTQLLEEEILDSLGIMYLVASLEDTYDIEINGEDIIPENFQNVNSINNLIKLARKD